MSGYNLGQLRGAFGAGMAAAEKKGAIVGKHFHSFHDYGIVNWQGRILSEPTPSTFLVQLYSWIDGNETEQKLISFAEMENWRFYSSDKEMVKAYEKKYGPETMAWTKAQWEKNLSYSQKGHSFTG